MLASGVLTEVRIRHKRLVLLVYNVAINERRSLDRESRIKASYRILNTTRTNIATEYRQTWHVTEWTQIIGRAAES